MANYDSLKVPPGALENGGSEIIRAAIADGELVMSLRRGFDDPGAWGRLLADVVKHVSNVYAMETKYNREDATKRMLETFTQEMAADTPGQIAARN